MNQWLRDLAKVFEPRGGQVLARSTGVWAAAVVVSLSACSQLGPLQPAAQNMNAVIEIRQGDPFVHKTVFKPGDGTILHVYLEGDGRPWWHRRQVAIDPTPKKALMLELMALDTAPSLYLGRPCYFQVSDASCDSRWWTQRRYSEAVVQSLAAVLQDYAQAYSGVRLFGHSGGGTLASLLVNRRDDVLGLVTLAGNLDVAAWTKWHGYSPLQESLDPANHPALKAVLSNSSMPQRHYAASQDRQVPPALIRQVVGQQWQQTLTVFEGIDHRCCWQQYWPSILQQITQTQP